MANVPYTEPVSVCGEGDEANLDVQGARIMLAVGHQGLPWEVQGNHAARSSHPLGAAS